MKRVLQQTPIILIPLVLLILYIPSSRTVAQFHSSNAPSLEIVADLEKSPEVSQKLYDSVLNELFDNEDQLQRVKYRLNGTRIVNDWGLLSFVSIMELEDNPAYLDDGTRTLVIFNETLDGTWDVGVRGTQKFVNLVLKTPDSFMSPESKQYFSLGSYTVQSVDDDEYLFPWKNGNSWTWTQSWHSCASNRCAMDFGTTLSDNRVLASEDGFITDMCTVGTKTINILVEHNNKDLSYWHIDDDYDESRIFLTAPVYKGEVLGRAFKGPFNNDGCGEAPSQGESSSHVHFKFPDSDITIDGWLFAYDDDEATKGQSTKYVNDSFPSTNFPIEVSACGSPPGSGTWTISSSCIMKGSKTPPGNVLVNSNSSVYIPGVNLNINFLSKKLTVKSGSKIHIVNGGKIY